MAIYHCSVKIISRSKGRSIVSASAYRSGTRLVNQETGECHNYENKRGIIYSEVLLCENAPLKYQDREVLWNEVQTIEKSKNSQLAREIEVALPRELTRKEQIQCVQNYIKNNFIQKGMCADWSLHDKGDGNPHAHILLTTRPIEKTGEWGVKERKGYTLDKEGNRIPILDSNGNQKKDSRNRLQWKRETIQANDWNKRENIEIWRKEWAKECNQYLSQENKIDHRSYKRQGIEKIPMIHEGYTARQLEKQHQWSERCEWNREIQKENGVLKLISEQKEKLEGEISLTKFYQCFSQGQAMSSTNKPFALEKITLAEMYLNQVLEKSNLLSEYSKSSLLEIQNKVQQQKNVLQTSIEQEQNFNIDQAISEGKERYEQYCRSITEYEQYEEYQENTGYRELVKELSQLQIDWNNVQIELNQLKTKQEELRFYEIKQKAEVKERIEVVEKKKEKIIKLMEKKRVKQISDIDFQIEKLKEKIQEEVQLVSSSQEYKQQLYQQITDSKDSLFSHIQQIPMSHRKQVIQEMTSQPRKENSISIKNRMKGYKAQIELQRELEKLLEVSKVKEVQQEQKKGLDYMRDFER